MIKREWIENATGGVIVTMGGDPVAWEKDGVRRDFVDGPVTVEGVGGASVTAYRDARGTVIITEVRSATVA